jgi:NAD(P)-dependent dehydrogenase (short-subunit alcohol dehydrogenase family)
MNTATNNYDPQIVLNVSETTCDEQMYLPGIKDAVAVVTGASGNLGRAVAEVLQRFGARTVLVDSTGPTAALERKLVLSGFDLTDEASVDALLERAVEQFGQADILVNTVGGFRGGKPVHTEDIETWDHLLSLNLRTALLMSRAFAGHMVRRGQGRIINVISRHALTGAANYAAYSASKAAVLRLTEAMASELKGSGVTANCVVPGTMDTPQNREGLGDAEAMRLVAPQDVANVIAFLASDAARSITGAAVPVYGKT